MQLFFVCFPQFDLVSSFTCRIRKQDIAFSESAVFVSWHVRSNEIEKYKLRSIKERLIYVFFVATLWTLRRPCCIFACYWNEGIYWAA